MEPFRYIASNWSNRRRALCALNSPCTTPWSDNSLQYQQQTLLKSRSPPILPYLGYCRENCHFTSIIEKHRAAIYKEIPSVPEQQA